MLSLINEINRFAFLKALVSYKYHSIVINIKKIYIDT